LTFRLHAYLNRASASLGDDDVSISQIRRSFKFIQLLVRAYSLVCGPRRNNERLHNIRLDFRNLPVKSLNANTMGLRCMGQAMQGETVDFRRADGLNARSEKIFTCFFVIGKVWLQI
jgi:hypothetical protein